MAKLTALKIQNLKPGTARREIPDAACRGLYVVLQPSGKRGWAVRYRFGGKPKKLTLDRGLSLAAARVAATKALSEVERGTDPAAAKVMAKVTTEKAAADAAADSVENMVKRFLDYQRKRLRPNSFGQTSHVFNNITLPAWRGRSVHTIRRRDIIDLVEAVAVDRPIMANRTLSQLCRFFNWLLARDVLAASPCTGVQRPTKEGSRERVLSDDEIKSLWLACETIASPASKAVQMLVLTGQRRNEVAGMRRSELSGAEWKLPAARVKNGKAHTVPLSKQALDLINGMPNLGDYVFSNDGERPVLSYAHVKVAIDAIMKPETPWVLHDLRRTVASSMPRLGVDLPVTEKILNHVSGSFAGVAGIYQRYDFASAKAVALQKWADHLDDIVNGTADGNVIRLVRP